MNSIKYTTKNNLIVTTIFIFSLLISHSLHAKNIKKEASAPTVKAVDMAPKIELIL